MKAMERRLSVLEQQRTGLAAITRWHWIDGDNGETAGAMTERYVAEHGPIGATEGTICWVSQ